MNAKSQIQRPLSLRGRLQSDKNWLDAPQAFYSYPTIRVIKTSSLKKEKKKAALFESVSPLHFVIIFLKKSPKQEIITPCQALIFTPEIC